MAAEEERGGARRRGPLFSAADSEDSSVGFPPRSIVPSDAVMADARTGVGENSAAGDDGGEAVYHNDNDDYYERDAPYTEWLKWYRQMEYPRYHHPDVTVDCVILTADKSLLRGKDRSRAAESLKILVVDRWTHPFKGSMALPGTFMRPDDADAQSVILRMLRQRFDFDVNSALEDETGKAYVPGNGPLDSGSMHIRQLQTFTGSRRDPRGQVVSIAHLVYLSQGLSCIPETDGVHWEPLLDMAEQEMAFDHQSIVLTAISRLRSQFAWLPQVFWTLPTPFTVTDALKLRASLFDEDYKAINRKNFKRKYQAVWEDDHVEINPITKMPVDFYRYEGAVFQ
ncbi:MAG: hypothetical protein LKJ47_06060 [Bifidobacteriaceae bacterium]|jgi:ADP-ribose pyrophosphatase YjhB (NUDIX family)|nr:hypothetical protein [Bifidobacteriaceae bacterium]